MARIGLRLASDDLPLPENRIVYDGDRVKLDVAPTNIEAHRRPKPESWKDLFVPEIRDLPGN